MKLMVPPPVVGLVCAGFIWAAAVFFSQYSIEIPFKKYVSALLFFVGVTIDLLALRIFHQADTTVSPFSPQKTSSLIAIGIYSYTRNPMYLGMVFLLLGLIVWFGNLLGVMFVVLFVWFVTHFQIKPEEAILLKKFGKSYDDYCQNVRRWM